MRRRPEPDRRRFATIRRRHDEDAEADDEVPLRVLGRADVPAEHLDAPDLGDRAEVAGEVLVAEDHLLDREAHAERDDGEVHAAGPQRGDREEHPDEDRERDAGEERELGRPVLVGDEARREQRAQSADRVLRERELPGVAGQHDDRQDEHADDQRREQRPWTSWRRTRTRRATTTCRRRATRNQRVTTPVPRSGSFSRTWLRSGSAFPRTTSTTTMTRNGSARCSPVAPFSIPNVSCRNVEMSLEYVSTSLSAMPSATPPSKRERERAEPTDERDRERGHGDDDREHREAEPGVGRQQDAGESRGRSADRPGDRWRGSSATSPAPRRRARSRRSPRSRARSACSA